MTRLRGPAPDSWSFLLVGGLFRSAGGLTGVAYAGLTGSTLADIRVDDGTDTPGAPIPGSAVTIDSATSAPPQFWFPDGDVSVVYMSVNGGPRTPVYANYSPRIDALEAGTTGAVHLTGSETITGAKNFTGGLQKAGKDVVASGDLALRATDAPYNMVGDGTTDNATGFAALLSAASTAKTPVYIPPGTYLIGSNVTLPSNVIITGAGAANTILKAASGFATSSVLGASSRTGVQVSDLTIDLNTSASIIYGIFAQSLTKSRFQRLKFVNGTANANGTHLWLQAVTDVDVVDCEFDTAHRGIMLNSVSGIGSCQRVKILRNKIHDLRDFGIYVLGDATNQADDVWIDDNQVWNIAAGTPRYPIYTTCPAGQYHRNFRIRGNRIIGNGTSFTDGTGTADNLAAYHLQDSVISGNISTLGGDGGIVTDQSRRLTITGNVAYSNNTHGIYLEASTDLTVTGNECYSNGQNWDGTTNTTAAARGGIRLGNTSDSIITGNRCHEPNSGSPKQQYGIVVYDATSTDNTAGVNELSGNSQGEIWYAAAVPATSRLRTVTTPAKTTFAYTGTTVAYPIPAGATVLIVEGIGGGAGGGSGARKPAATATGGGGGGGGAGRTRHIFAVTDLAGPLQVTVGAGGAGGAAVTVDGANGNAGTSGGTTFIRDTTNTIAYLRATAGAAGAGGTTAGGTAGGAGVGEFLGGGGGAGGVAAASNGVSVPGGPGGGGGAGISAADAAGTAGLGAYATNGVELLQTAVGTNGSNRIPAGVAGGGASGGGGNASTSGAASAGGNGGNYGAGGGGGGASRDGNTSGAGGAGSPGYATIVAY